MIKIINCGSGNVGSIINMLKKIGVKSEIIFDPTELETAEKIILPGVGAFDACMSFLEETGFIEPLKKNVLERKKPLLGICAGMQIICAESEEGLKKGLGFIPINFSKFKKIGHIKIPHMGWNSLTVKKASPIVTGIEEMKFYFVHSYKAPLDSKYTLATTIHGEEFSSVIGYKNIFGMQFHPEKSHKYGMKILKNFVDFC